MPTETKNWTQKQKDRFATSGAMNYIIDVIDGTQQEPDRARLDSCWKALNKLIPDLKAIEHQGDVDHTVTLKWK